MVITKITQNEKGFAVEAERDTDGCKIYQDIDNANNNAPIETEARAQEIESEIRAMLEAPIPDPFPIPEPPKPDIEILKEENEKLKQDLKSTQSAVDFILMNY